MIRRRFFLLIAIFLLVLSACNKAQREMNDPKIVKISLLSSGRIVLNGQPATLEEVAKALKTSKAQNGQVWYYREHAEVEGPPQSAQIIQLIIDNNLPVSLSTKPDYSDSVDGQGQSHPRTQK